MTGTPKRSWWEGFSEDELDWLRDFAPRERRVVFYLFRYMVERGWLPEETLLPAKPVRPPFQPPAGFARAARLRPEDEGSGSGDRTLRPEDEAWLAEEWESFQRQRMSRRRSARVRLPAPESLEVFRVFAVEDLYELLEVRRDAAARRAQKADRAGGPMMQRAFILGRCAGCDAPLVDRGASPYCSDRCKSATRKRRTRQSARLREKRDRCGAPGCRRLVPEGNTTYCTAACRDAARAARRRTGARHEAVSDVETGA